MYRLEAVRLNKEEKRTNYSDVFLRDFWSMTWLFINECFIVEKYVGCLKPPASETKSCVEFLSHPIFSHNQMLIVCVPRN
jgi:hypothetical protein